MYSVRKIVDERMKTSTLEKLLLLKQLQEALVRKLEACKLKKLKKQSAGVVDVIPEEAPRISSNIDEGPVESHQENANQQAEEQLAKSQETETKTEEAKATQKGPVRLILGGSSRKRCGGKGKTPSVTRQQASCRKSTRKTAGRNIEKACEGHSDFNDLDPEFMKAD